MEPQDVTAFSAGGATNSNGADASMRRPSLRQDAERMRKGLAQHRRTADLRDGSGDRFEGIAAMRSFSSSF